VSVPVLFAWLGAYDTSRLRSELDATSLRMVQHAERAYANPESSLCDDFTVRSGGFAAAQYIRIGGDPDMDDLARKSIAYRMAGQSEYAFPMEFLLNETDGDALFLYPRAAPYQVCFLRPIDCGQGRGCDYVTARVVE